MNMKKMVVIFLLIISFLTVVYFGLFRTVTFDTQMETQVKVKYVIIGNSTQLPDLQRTGYTFIGWFDVQGNKFTSESIINKNIELQAYWDPTFYTIYFDTNGGTERLPYLFHYNSDIYLPADPIKENNLFVGWFEDELFTVPFDVSKKMPDYSFTLYALWETTN